MTAKNQGRRGQRDVTVVADLTLRVPNVGTLIEDTGNAYFPSDGTWEAIDGGSNLDAGRQYMIEVEVETPGNYWEGYLVATASSAPAAGAVGMKLTSMGPQLVRLPAGLQRLWVRARSEITDAYKIVRYQDDE